MKILIKIHNIIEKRLRFLKFVMPYFDSEWSFAKFRVTESRTKVGFGSEPNSIVVISYTGLYFHAIFDPIEGGECKAEESLKFF